MNDVIKSGNIIKKIRDGKQLEEIALFARNCIFRDGPKDTLVLEILSYLKLFQPTFGYHDIPDKDLTAYPLVSTSIAAKDVDYDLIVYDTYDYLDKLIGFKLSDIFYAIFYQYYEATSDERALRLAKYFKYGTDKEREIWMLRYGFSFEEIEWVSECVDSIDETEIKFNDKINALDDAQLKSIEQYVHE